MNNHELANTGWLPICGGWLPPRDQEVEFIREGEEELWRATWALFGPAFNIAGLWWRRCAPMIDVTPSVLELDHHPK